MKILIIEDSNERIKAFKRLFKYHELHFAKSGSEAIEKIPQGWDLISFDYDLGGAETSEEAARFLGKNPGYTKDVVIHSYNPVGAEKLNKIFSGFPARRIIL